MQTPSVKALSLLGCLDRPLETFHDVQGSNAHTVLAYFFLERAVAVATHADTAGDCFSVPLAWQERLACHDG